MKASSQRAWWQVDLPLMLVLGAAVAGGTRNHVLQSRRQGSLLDADHEVGSSYPPTQLCPLLLSGCSQGSQGGATAPAGAEGGHQPKLARHLEVLTGQVGNIPAEAVLQRRAA